MAINRDVPAVNGNSAIVDFTENNATTKSFNHKVKLTGQTSNDGTKNVKIIVRLKYLSNFWRTLEMSLINCKIILDLNWCKNCITVAHSADQDTKFSMTDTKLYVNFINSR